MENDQKTCLFQKIFFTTLLILPCTGQDSKLKIPILDLFDLHSASERAFSFAFELASNRSDPKFKLERITSYHASPLLDSESLRKRICTHLESRSIVAAFGGNMWNVIDDLTDLTTSLNLPFFTSETPPIETINTSSLIIKSTSKYSGFRWSDAEVNKNAGQRTGPLIAAYGFRDEEQREKGLKKERNTTALQSYVVQMRPHVVEVIADIIMYYKWVNFSYVCNTGEGLIRLQKIMELIHTRQDYVEIYVDIRYIPDSKVAEKDLRRLDEYLCQLSEKNVLIDFDNEENIALFMRKIVLMGMNRKEYHYILTGLGLDEANLTEFKFSGVNIMGLQILNQDNIRVKRFQENWNSWNSINLIKSGFSKRGPNFKTALMVDAMFVFIDVIDRMLDNPSMRKKLESYVNNPGSATCYSKRGQGQGGSKVYGFFNREYKIKKNPVGSDFISTLLRAKFSEPGLTGKIEFSPQGCRENSSFNMIRVVEDKGPVLAGTWNHDTGLIVNKFGEIKLSEAAKLIRKTLRVVTIEGAPFVVYDTMRNGENLTGNDRFSGFCVDIIKELAKTINFKYELQLVADQKYGAIDPSYPNDTKWNGMIGEIMDEKADICIAPLTISFARAKVVHFSEPFLTFGISIMIKKPGKKKPGIFSFLYPLSEHVWWAILAACLMISCGLFVIARISPFEWRTNVDPEGITRIERDFCWFNAFWFSFAAFVQQGVDIAPRSPGARLLSSAWWFFTLIMIAYYTANLAAFLTVAHRVPPINSWEDLVKQDHGIAYGPVNSGSTKDFLMTTDLEPYSQMGEYLSKNTGSLSSSVLGGVERVRQSRGKYAFLLESRTNEYHNNREPCDTMMVGTPFGDKAYGVATRKNFALNDQLNDAILTLREKQKLAELYKTWWIEKGQCTDDDGQNSKAEALALINVAGVFYILAAGLTLALATSLAEFYYNAKKDYSKNSIRFSEFLHKKARLSIHGPSGANSGRRPRERVHHQMQDNCGPPPPARTINLI